MSTARPVVTYDAEEDEMVGSGDTWEETPDSRSYQWKRNGANTGTDSDRLDASSLANGDIIVLVVTATDENGSTSRSSLPFTFEDDEPGEAPTGLASIRFTGAETSDITNFIDFQTAATAEGPFTTLWSIPSLGIGTEIDELIFGNAYYTNFFCRMVARNDEGISELTYDPFEWLTRPEAPPTGLSLEVLGDSSIKATWNEGDGETKVYLGGVLNATKAEGVTEHTFTGLSADTEFAVKLKSSSPQVAYEGSTPPDQDTEFSTEVLATTDADVVNTDYVDLLASYANFYCVWPLTEDASSSNPGFDGVADGVTFGGVSIVTEAGPSALFEAGNVVEIPNIAAATQCGVELWFSAVDLHATGYEGLAFFDGWGIYIVDGNLHGLVQGVNIVGTGYPVVEGETYYCMCYRGADTNWHFSVNGVDQGAAVGGSPSALGFSRIGSADNLGTYRISHVGFYYGGAFVDQDQIDATYLEGSD